MLTTHFHARGSPPLVGGNVSRSNLVLVVRTLRTTRKRSARIASSSIAGNARDRASECAPTGTRKQLYHPSFNFLSAYRVYTDMGYGAKRIRRVHDDACRSPIFVFENFVDSDTRSARDSPALRRVSRSFLSLRVPPGDDAPRFSPTVLRGR